MRKRFGLVEPQADWEVRMCLCMCLCLCLCLRLCLCLCLCLSVVCLFVLSFTFVQVQRLAKELGLELFGQHVKSFETSSLT